MTPTASVIVATFNRPQKLVGLLRSLAAQSFPRDRFEVVVVDDGSPEPIAPLTQEFTAALQLRVHRQTNSGPAVARNTAIHLARGRFLAMVDDDCEPDPDWLALLVAALGRYPDAMVGGHTINGLTKNTYSTVSQMIVDRVYAVHNANPNAAGFFTSNNLAVSRDALLALGGFDERYRFAGGEDRGLNDRWRHSGNPMIYVPEAVVMHFHNLNLARFLRQHFNYGRGAILYHRTRVSSLSEEAGTARGIVLDWGAWRGDIRRQRGQHSGPTIVGLLVLWQAANAAGYFWELVARNTRLSALRETPTEPSP